MYGIYVCTNTVIMQTIRTLYEENKKFFNGYFLFTVLSLVLLLTFSKAGSFLLLNTWHYTWANNFFRVYTFLGDGIFSLLLVLFFLLRKKYRLTINLLTAFLLSGLVSQVFKNLIYSPRPRMFFLQNQYDYFIGGVSLSNASGFPSGHTASAFAAATILTLFSLNKRYTPYFLLAAVMVGYSRIYLAQHFLGDVVAGAFVGVAFALISYWLIQVIRPLSWKWYPPRYFKQLTQ